MVEHNFLRALLGVGVTTAFTFIIVIFQGLLYPEIPPYFVRYTISLILVSAVIAMGTIAYYTKRNYKLSRPGPQQPPPGTTPQVDFYLAQNASYLAFYIFGSVCIGTNIMHFLSDVYCLHYFGQNSYDNTIAVDWTKDWLQDQISRVVLTLSQIVFFACAIGFLGHLVTFEKRIGNHWSHNLLLIVISSCIATWLYTYLRETGFLHMADPKNNTEVIPIYSLACQDHATPVYVFNDSTTSITYPFIMEFLFAALELLLAVWFLDNYAEHMTDKVAPMDGDRNLREPPICELREPGEGDPSERESNEGQPSEGQLGEGQLGDGQPSEGQPSEGQTSEGEYNLHEPCQQKCQILKIFNFYTAFLFGIIEITTLTFFLITQEYHSHHPGYLPHNTEIFYEVPVMVTRIFFTMLLPLVATVICYASVANFRAKRENAVVLSGKYVIIVLAVCATIILAVFDIGRCLYELLKSDVKWDNAIVFKVEIVESLVNSPLFIFLALFMHKVLTYRAFADLSRPLNPYLIGMIEYLAMYNFMRWIIDSFLESTFETERLAFQDIGEKSWEYILHLCMPLMIYFRYISTFLLLEMKYLLKNDEAQLHAQPSEQQIETSNSIEAGTGRSNPSPLPHLSKTDKADEAQSNLEACASTSNPDPGDEIVEVYHDTKLDQQSEEEDYNDASDDTESLLPKKDKKGRKSSNRDQTIN